jgi:hypothetical protein
MTFGLPVGLASLYISVQKGRSSKSVNDSGRPTWNWKSGFVIQ